VSNRHQNLCSLRSAHLHFTLYDTFVLGRWGSISGRDKGLFLYFLRQNQPWGPPSLLSSGYGDPFLGVKHGRVVTLTTHSRLVPRSRMSKSYTSSPPKRLPVVRWGSSALLYTFRLIYYIHCTSLIFYALQIAYPPYCCTKNKTQNKQHMINIGDIK
jgi:hypothetical protein